MSIQLVLGGQQSEVLWRSGYLQATDNQTLWHFDLYLEAWAIPIFLGITFLIGIVGNGALFYTICIDHKLRSVPNAFVLSIALCNILLLILCVPLVAASFVLEQTWPFGTGACKMIQCLPQATLAISMFSLIGLSIERYGAFASPPKRRSSAACRARVGMLFIWILGALCGLPPVVFAYNDATRYENEMADPTVICVEFGRSWSQTQYPKIHTVVSMSLLLAVPVILVLIFYLSLSCVVCAKKLQESGTVKDEDIVYTKANGGRTSRSGTLTKTSTLTKTNTIRTNETRQSPGTLKRNSKKRKTMAKASVLLIIQFTVLWAPKAAYAFMFYFFTDRMSHVLIWHIIRLVGMCCIYLNAALVPFTVVISNRAFRRSLGKYLCCCCSCVICCFDCRKSSTRADDSISETQQGKGSSSSKPSSRCCCGTKGGNSDSNTEESPDLPDSSSYRDTSHGAVYQEVRSQPAYDTYQPFHSISLHGNSMPALNNETYFTREEVLKSNGYLPVADNEPYQQNGYVHPYGDVPERYVYDRPVYDYGYAHDPQLLSYRPLPSIEPLDGAAAEEPKYSRVYQPKTLGYVDTAMSIKEPPAI